ncbi:MAG: hypothetical protein DWQ02_01735 [Bacteroidetes bacterium]|nr:MAG: hypothetical protein DWQ02_01735 [Bacteroidota bacterium]
MSFFIANKPNGKDSYYIQFKEYLGGYGYYESIEFEVDFIKQLPGEKAEEIIQHLLGLACITQNISNINIGRYFLQQLKSEWLLSRIFRLSKSLLDSNNYWEYNRLMELFLSLDSNLAEKLAELSLKNNNPEIVEIGKEFFNDL